MMADWMAQNPYDEEVQRTLEAYRKQGLREWLGFEDGLLQTGFNEGRLAQARKLLEWGQKNCTEHKGGENVLRRFHCFLCMEQLKREIG